VEQARLLPARRTKLQSRAAPETTELIDICDIDGEAVNDHSVMTRAITSFRMPHAFSIIHFVTAMSLLGWAGTSLQLSRLTRRSRK
jgi:hypothetical protein